MVTRLLFLLLVGSCIYRLSAMEQKEKTFDLTPKEWNASLYDDMMQCNAVCSLIKKYDLKTLFRGARCLDLGCGLGGVTSLFNHFVQLESVEGIDASNDMIELATACYASDKMLFKHCSAEALNVQDSYNLVVSFFVLHWIKDKKLVLNNVFNALTSEGCFFATCDAPHAGMKHENSFITKLKDEFPSFKEVFNSGSSFNDLLGRYQGSSEEIFQLLTEAGFVDITVESCDIQLEFTQEEFGDFQKSQFFSRPFMNNIPEEEREAIFNRFVELTCEQLEKTEENKCVYPYKKLVIKAFKP